MSTKSMLPIIMLLLLLIISPILVEVCFNLGLGVGP